MPFNLTHSRNRDTFAEVFEPDARTGRLKRTGYKARTLEAKLDTTRETLTVGGYYSQAKGSKTIEPKLCGCTLRVEDAGEAYRGTTGYYCEDAEHDEESERTA